LKLADIFASVLGVLEVMVEFLCCWFQVVLEVGLVIFCGERRHPLIQVNLSERKIRFSKPPAVLALHTIKNGNLGVVSIQGEG